LIQNIHETISIFINISNINYTYTNSNELIKIDLVPKYSSSFLTFEYQIRTKYAYILYKDYITTVYINEKKY